MVHSAVVRQVFVVLAVFALASPCACSPREVAPTEALPPLPRAGAATLADAERLDTESITKEDAADLTGALATATNALHIREQLPAADTIIARSLVRVAHLQWLLGRYVEAGAAIDRALPILERDDPDSAYVGSAVLVRAITMLHEHRYADAKPLLARALTLLKPAGTAFAMDYLEAMDDMGLVYKAQGDTERALNLYVDALAFGENTFGKDSFKLASVVGNYGETLRRQGDYTRAVTTLERAIRLAERAYGPDSRHAAADINNLAVAYQQQGNLAGAEPLFRRALSITERDMGPDDVATAQEYMNLGNVLCQLGNATEGRPLYLRGLDVFERHLGPDDGETLAAKNTLNTLVSCR